MSKKLLVTVDSLRYDHFDLMENTREFLDNEHSTAFSASTATAGSFQGIICSEYPTNNGVNDMETFPSVMDTYKIGITTNNFLSERYGYGEYFDYFECPRKNEVNLRSKVGMTLDEKSRLFQFLSFGFNNFQKLKDKFVTVEDTFRPSSEVVDTFLNKIPEQNDWFGWIHLMEPHHPYEPENGGLKKVEYQNKTRKVINGTGTEKDKEIVREGYKNEIKELDNDLEKLWNNLPNNTDVIFTSDHGELLGEYNDKWGHMGIAVPELLHIPFATKNIDISDRNIVSHIDIGSMFLDNNFGQGQFQREYAYATYGDEKAIMTPELVYDGKRAIDLDGNIIEGDYEDETLHNLWSNFNPNSVDYKKEGLKEDLEDLGYL